MKDSPEWNGTPSQLLDSLTSTAKNVGIDTKGKDWPDVPHILMRRLNEISQDLEDNGIKIEQHSKWIDGKTKRLINISTSTPVQVDENQETGSEKSANEASAIPPNTDAMLQFNLQKGTYYNDDKGKCDQNLLNCVALLSNYMAAPDIEGKVKEFSERKVELSMLQELMQRSEAGMEYMEVREKKETRKQIAENMVRIPELRQEIIGFIEDSMKKKGLMAKRITRLQLLKLPLDMKGGSEAVPIDEEEDYEEYEEIE